MQLKIVQKSFGLALVSIKPTYAKRAGVSRQAVSLLERDGTPHPLSLPWKYLKFSAEQSESGISAWRRTSDVQSIKWFYYVVVAALVVSIFLLIGIDLSKFSPHQSDQFIWAYLPSYQ